MYADTITDSMAKTIAETNRRREIQLHYNEEHNITPHQIQKARTMGDLVQAQQQIGGQRAYVDPEPYVSLVAEPVLEVLSSEQLAKKIKEARSRMQEAARKLDFTTAALLRDELIRMETMQKSQ